MLAPLLLAAALSIPTNTMVLRTGERIAIEPPLRVDGVQVLFRAGGRLFTIPAEEVDLEASRSEESPAQTQVASRAMKLRVSKEERDRLLRDLEENHSGTAAPMGRLDVLPALNPSQRAQLSDEEWAWRNKTRDYEEGITRAKEDLNLLQDKAEALKAHIAGLLSLGFKPNQFTYDSTQLAYTLDQIPQAELEVTRSQRVYEQFRDDARKQGVTPGWLR